MKKTLIALLTVAAFAVTALTVSAESGGKEITIKGEAKCLKCALGQGDKCQTVIESTNKEGKKTTFNLADNDVSKKFHGQICKGPKEASATGTCKKVDGKLVVTASKIEAK